MSNTNKLERQFEDFVVGQMNDGVLLADVKVSELHAAVAGSKYTDCAEWLDAYKARFGVLAVAEQPEWFKAFLDSLTNAGESMWPRIFEHMRIEVASVKHQEQEEKQNLQSQLTDALNTVGKYEEQIQSLQEKLTDYQGQVKAKEETLAEAQAKIIEMAGESDSSLNEETLDALKEAHEQAMIVVTTAHGQTVELLNNKVTGLESLLAESREETDRLTSEVEFMRTERDELRVERDKLKGEHEELNAQAEEARTQIKELEIKVKDLMASQSPDAKKLEKQVAKVDELKREVKALNNRIVCHENRNEMLVQQNAQQAEQLQKSTERLFAASEAQFKAEAESEVLRGQLDALNLCNASEGSERAPQSDALSSKDRKSSKGK
ncbi:hypothetical protein MKR81_27300 (plasmid) [Vibrio campbellii]|uniref:hypothetical protein n=1 Tax=Vibrio campbellii TaxID=680 RepID=UPI001F07A8D8|nr:hypothetical protein [Vibrio campbellii]UMM06657.1 hypothetical protein MKR81_27300 [Vibrio campbellii]